ncbi:hypothetical protein [Chitinophaga sp. Cy-1792]|uniref:LIC11966 family surface protein n=1 Tax=Chitinophaga sp. Cy-1792 TaxID=2608339 RepID=UPI001421649A|nr:hypothetical protein [Chitinophaga sp. Cy-1792]NIG54906.1 hypothetical protein [Chitinophaga sp. Cy-1792]
MKRVNAIPALLFAAIVAVCLSSCGAVQNPVEYNNKLMMVVNDNEKSMNEMNTAMAGQDYSKAEVVRKSWAEKLDKSISEVDKMEDLKEDEGLKAAVVKGLKGYQQIAATDYKNLIELRNREKSGDATVQLQIQASLTKINNGFDAIAGTINKASNDFEKKYNK